MDKELKTIGEFVNQGREIEYLIALHTKTNLNLENILNYSFDLYNRYKKMGYKDRTCRVVSLSATTDHVVNLYNKCLRDDNYERET